MRETYAQLVAADALAALDFGTREAAWRRILTEDVTNVWVAVDSGRVVGWAAAGSGHAAEGPQDWEVEGIYVLASHYGRGIGQALLDVAVGDRPAFLWVAAENPRAHAFYLRNGFAADGASGEHPLAGTPVRIVRFAR